MGQFKRSKQIFCKFKGQFELEIQGQGNQCLKTILRPLDYQYTVSIKFEAKISNSSKVVAFKNKYTKFSRPI